MSTSNKVLALKNITVTSGKTKILDSFSAWFPMNSITTIIGKSGVGKTTLMKSVAGLIKSMTGELILDGQPFIPRENVIAMVPQDYGLLPWETVNETIVNAMKITHKQIEPEKIAKLFEALNLTGQEAKYPHELSGGQKQRTSLARAFSVDAELLLMDEPFSALDVVTRENTQELFLALWQREKPTTLFVTHDIEEAIKLGEQIFVLKQDGSTELIDKQALPTDQLLQYLKEVTAIEE
jgi:NitT/TauT family transport system ATP-binding protein